MEDPQPDVLPGDDAGGRPEPLPDEVVERALADDDEALEQVERSWEDAGSMEGTAPTG